MSALSEKLRRAREERVPVGKHVFVIRRPTDVEMMRLSQPGTDVADLIPHVVGWEKVTEEDLLPGAMPVELPFDADACREWLSDRSDLLMPLVNRIRASWAEHKAQLEAAGKN